MNDYALLLASGVAWALYTGRVGISVGAAIAVAGLWAWGAA